MNNKDRVKKSILKSSIIFRKNIFIKELLKREKDEKIRFKLELILKNAKMAIMNNAPLCDDTGIPHVVLEVGRKSKITKKLIKSIEAGISEGLKSLPGRPMCVKGDLCNKITQCKGMYKNPSKVKLHNIILKKSNNNGIKFNILMQGGGPEIRSITKAVYHKHNYDNFVQDISTSILDNIGLLGCDPVTLSIGVGRSHYEATSLMIEATLTHNISKQSDIERDITKRINDQLSDVIVLATFIKVGDQRASGVRIVCIRPNCIMEPRLSTCKLK